MSPRAFWRWINVSKYKISVSSSRARQFPDISSLSINDTLKILYKNFRYFSDVDQIFYRFVDFRAQKTKIAYLII